jgi:glyoxylase-like metal-dependent hydrolase (beta-lactamase superfamily II)
MFWNRKRGNALLRIVSAFLFGFGKKQRFTPDFYVEDGDDFAGYGFKAQVVTIPGHSKGSIGVLTSAGDLLCGDLFENNGTPALNSIMDDPATANASIEKLKTLNINTVYPGHGAPFSMEQFLKDRQESS